MEPQPQFGRFGEHQQNDNIEVYREADYNAFYRFEEMPLGLRPEDDNFFDGLQPMDLTDDVDERIEVRVYRTPPEFIAGTAVLFQGAFKGIQQLFSRTRQRVVIPRVDGHRYIVYPRFRKIY